MTYIRDTFLVALEGTANVLEDLRCEQVDAAADERAHEGAWLLHVVHHLKKRIA